MSETRAIPGDPLVICDICGFKMHRSQTRKTWNGLRVCNADWEPKHPLLNIRAKVDRQAVQDARPEPVDRFVTIPYGLGSFSLISPNGTHFILHIDDDGALLVDPGFLGEPLEYFPLGSWRISVDDDGAVLVSLSPAPTYLTHWKMTSPGNNVYQVTADSDGAILVVAI